MREKLGPDREKMTGLAMLERLEQAGLFHPKDTTKLKKLLEECDCCDLVNNYLEPYRRKFADNLEKENSPLGELY
jgi:hypothetical protein